jgi:hypothetical protein
MSAGLALLLGMGVADAAPMDQACGIYSEDVVASGNAWSGCALKRAGEKPLWKEALDPAIIQVVRLVFSSGHDGSFRYVTLVQRADGTSRIESGGVDARYRQPRHVWSRRGRNISPQDWVEIDRLAEASGTFDFDIGSWDGEEIFAHCQNLALERANRAGYRFSSVAIGCNRPAKLAPLVDKVTELAGRRALFDGWRPE